MINHLIIVGRRQLRWPRIFLLLLLDVLRPGVGAACLRLGADHERVVPHGLRLLGTLIQLLSVLPVEGSETCAVALDASWLPDASCMLVAGLQSSSMKVSMPVLRGGLLLPTPNSPFST